MNGDAFRFWCKVAACVAGILCVAGVLAPWLLFWATVWIFGGGLLFGVDFLATVAAIEERRKLRRTPLPEPNQYAGIDSVIDALGHDAVLKTLSEEVQLALAPAGVIDERIFGESPRKRWAREMRERDGSWTPYRMWFNETYPAGGHIIGGNLTMSHWELEEARERVARVRGYQSDFKVRNFQGEVVRELRGNL